MLPATLPTSATLIIRALTPYAFSDAAASRNWEVVQVNVSTPKNMPALSTITSSLRCLHSTSCFYGLICNTGPKLKYYHKNITTGETMDANKSVGITRKASKTARQI